jgi:hypothetical protein
MPLSLRFTSRAKRFALSHWTIGDINHLGGALLSPEGKGISLLYRAFRNFVMIFALWLASCRMRIHCLSHGGIRLLLTHQKQNPICR